MHSTSRTSKLSGLAAANELVRLGGPKNGCKEMLTTCAGLCFAISMWAFHQGQEIVAASNVTKIGFADTVKPHHGTK
jgi:hypothetical protein